MTKYTPEGVPVISDGTYLSTIGILKRDSRNTTFGKEIKERLGQENPLIFRMIDEITRYYGEGEFSDGFAVGASMVYEMIRRELAAGRLEEEIGL